MLFSFSQFISPAEITIGTVPLNVLSRLICFNDYRALGYKSICCGMRFVEALIKRCVFEFEMTPYTTLTVREAYENVVTL